MSDLVITADITEAQKKIMTCYQTLEARQSNLVWEFLKDQGEFTQWQHYPKGDVKDKINHSQYYYHSHPSKDVDRVPEHGHFHVFKRLHGVGVEYKPLFLSEKYKNDNTKDYLCHLFAVAMNEYGFPTALFTTNHWVTAGLWYSAEDCCQMLDLFFMDETESAPIANRWLNGMVTLFKEPIKELICHRDVMMQEFLADHPDCENIYTDRRLEVISILQLV